jgi:hypothetical protein
MGALPNALPLYCGPRPFQDTTTGAHPQRGGESAARGPVSEAAASAVAVRYKRLVMTAPANQGGCCARETLKR